MNQRGLSIAETARQMRQHLPAGEGFTATNLTHYRQGRSVPRPKYLEALSRVLEVDPSALTPEGTNTGGQSRASAESRLAVCGPRPAKPMLAFKTARRRNQRRRLPTRS